MIIDKKLPVIKANDRDSYIMTLCGETHWIKFIDRVANQKTISDFRTNKELKAFLPNITLSQFINTCEMGQIKKLRIHRMNLLRHSLPSYNKQWEILGNDYIMKDNVHTGYYSVDFSNRLLKTNKRLKLSVIKYVK